MKYNRYKIEDINIGDEVYFDDAYSGKILTQSNFDEYWTVHGINNDQLLVNFLKLLFVYMVIMAMLP